MTKKKTSTVITKKIPRGFPIVGIGASAGGLAAFEAFFAGMPAETEPGMAFVLVQHLAPDHKSILTDLVKRYTSMQVYEVEDGMVVKPNCTYIIPPNCDMAFLNGTLQLLQPAFPHGLRLPIDFFFRSLAHDQHERAIGIVLSGTGSDGTLGIRAIKGEGGMVMAQNPESTQYDGMPRNAIATGLVDYTMPPSEMPAQLIGYVVHAFGKMPKILSATADKSENAMKKILVLLRTQTGHNFSQYKQNSIIRRVERRLAVHQIDSLDRYVLFLQKTPAEIEALFHDLLIGVTAFFRDPEAFETLNEKVIPQLLAHKKSGDSVRIWVPGCSTGEEAYSIAILIHKHMDILKRNFDIKIFASDIDRRAIEHARSGIYPVSITADITPDILTQFFTLDPEGKVYRVQKVIRDMVVFSEQDLTKDPPFSKLDLISCRNLLIYMDGELQKKIIPMFHYSLNPQGLLFLGNSETVGNFINLFSTVNRKWKIYQRVTDTFETFPPARPKIFQPQVKSEGVRLPVKKKPADNYLQLSDLAVNELIMHYNPVGILINEHGEILYIHGRTGKYLEPAHGEAGVNILKMAREGLKRPLNNAIQRTVIQKTMTRFPGIRVKTNGKYTLVNLTVRPVSTVPGKELVTNLLLVIFEELSQAEKNIASKIPGKTTGEQELITDALIKTLEQELKAKDEYLQSTIEEMDTTNEELKSTNEELQSVNEELQSTNEELETSKEELQSMNEELTTVNTELQTKFSELTRTNNDMNNLLAGTGVGTVFVDQKLQIRRFTPSIKNLINLIQTDIGRPLAHIVSNLVGYDRLVEDVGLVLDNLTPKEIEVQTTNGSYYLMKILPYRTLENVIEGAVITFIDITELKKMKQSLFESESLQRLAAVVRDSSDAIILQDLKGKILAWNPGAERLFGWNERESLGMNMNAMIPENQRKSIMTKIQKLAHGKKIESFHIKKVTKSGQVIEVNIIATTLLNDNGESYAISTLEREV